MFDMICNTLTEYVDVEKNELTRETDFITDLHMNSYDFVSILGDLEDTLGIEIPDTDVRGLRTIGDVEDYIKTRIA